MPTSEKFQSWQSVHTDYIEFALTSYGAARVQAARRQPGMHIDRNVVDAVRYSFDCLEASVEFVYSMGRLRQLPIALPDNWLVRYLHRTWRNLSLSDRVGILAYGWAHSTFWENANQFQLFTEWKKVRDGLTHPIPYGSEIEREIISEEEVEAGALLKTWRFVGDEKQIGPKSMCFRTQDSLAEFSQNPASLTHQDAAKALEIMLRHLIRLEEVFFRARTTWFSYLDASANSLLSAHDLLEQMEVSFKELW